MIKDDGILEKLATVPMTLMNKQYPDSERELDYDMSLNS